MEEKDIVPNIITDTQTLVGIYLVSMGVMH